jgi:hypothetical protein
MDTGMHTVKKSPWQTRREVAQGASRTSLPTGFLQRKCACGSMASLSGECTECTNKRLQRSPIAAVRERTEGKEIVPSIVHEALRSPGQPLDAGTRSFLEPRFGHDFSRVRIHTDAKAADSVQAVNALAYTVGRDVVFARGHYAPHTAEGRRILAHELTHVLQQAEKTPYGEFRVGPIEDASEREADRIALALASHARPTARLGVGGHPGLLQRQSAPGSQPVRPWNPNDISTGLISTCWSNARPDGQYVSEKGAGLYSSVCSSPCAREPLPLHLLFHVDGDTIPRPKPFEPSRLSATVSFLPSSGGPESVLVKGIAKGSYAGPGVPLQTSLRTDLSFFTPPQTGALDVSLINSDPSSGAVAVYTDRVPVVDCPRSTRAGMAPPQTALELGIWLVVPDPENAPLEYQKVDKNTPLEGRGPIVSVFRDESGYFYTYKGRRVYLPERP